MINEARRRSEPPVGAWGKLARELPVGRNSEAYCARQRAARLWERACSRTRRSGTRCNTLRYCTLRCSALWHLILPRHSCESRNPVDESENGARPRFSNSSPIRELALAPTGVWRHQRASRPEASALPCSTRRFAARRAPRSDRAALPHGLLAGRDQQLPDSRFLADEKRIIPPSLWPAYARVPSTASSAAGCGAG